MFELGDRVGLGGMFELGAMLASRQQGKHAGRRQIRDEPPSQDMSTIQRSRSCSLPDVLLLSTSAFLEQGAFEELDDRCH